MFDVALNDHIALPAMDIMEEAGFGTVYQAIITFSVTDDRTTLEVPGTDSSGIEDGLVMLEFKPVSSLM